MFDFEGPNFSLRLQYADVLTKEERKKAMKKRNIPPLSQKRRPLFRKGKPLQLDPNNHVV